MKINRQQMAIGGALILGALALTAVFLSRGKPVEVVLVTQGPLTQTVVTSGRMATPARTDIASQTTARIESMAVREGDRVQAGQVLVQLRDDEAQAALRQASASVDEARLRIRQIQTIQGPVTDQQLAQARVNQQQAQQELARAQDLVRQGFVSQSRLDEAQRAADSSRAAVLAASAQAQGNQANGAELAMAQARLAQALAAQSAATARLDQFSLRAPGPATVITRAADPGDTAQAGKVLLTLAGGNEMRIDASVDEKNLRFLRLGQMAHATADAYTDRHFPAKLTFIAPSVDPQRGTLELRLQVAPPMDYLRTDMTVSVEIVTAQVVDALMLPSDAVSRDADGMSTVWVNREGRARRVKVQVGLQGAGATQITQGLAAGEHAILLGTGLKDGDRVRETGTRSPRPQAAAQPGGAP
jgi:HlyD family secretion protein